MNGLYFVSIFSFLAYCYGFHVHHHQSALKRRGVASLKSELFKGNPWGKKVWDWVWKQDLMKPGKPGVSPTSFGDGANVLRKNIEQIYGGEPSFDGAPIAEGEVDGLLDGALFLALQKYYQDFGGVFKLLFGPKSFIVVSDPVIIKHILRDRYASTPSHSTPFYLRHVCRMNLSFLTYSTSFESYIYLLFL